MRVAGCGARGAGIGPASVTSAQAPAAGYDDSVTTPRGVRSMAASRVWRS